MSRPRLRIVLAEDAVLLREGLIELLGRFGHQVVAAVDDAEGLLTAVDETRPDVVVTDVRMPPGFTDEGLQAAVALRDRYSEVGILVLTQYVATAYAFELLESGVRCGGGLGYMLKDRVGAVTEFIGAVERIADGGTVIDPDVVRQLLRRQQKNHPVDRLTLREREVLALMAEGRNNAAIAAELGVSQAAVAKNIGNVFVKLNLSEASGHRRVLAVLSYLRR
ncbi:response regulator transcription factor [Amycolatopsis samaneae]|uniref:Response regulator n=1 Tax=Amycolatopsis samaneae TaxID=664691 RepID=A0ABW5GRP0_9PSEU